MELVAFLAYHSERLGRAARWLEKKKKINKDDALQLLYVAAGSLLRDVCVDLDGNVTHLRKNPEFYVAIEPSSPALASYIACAAVRDVIDELDSSKGSSQRKFEESMATLREEDEPIFDPASSMVVSDLAQKTIEYARALGESYASAVSDLLANEDLAVFNPSTVAAWTSEYMARPVGRSLHKIPNEFIFKANGLTSKQGRILLNRVTAFVVDNGFVPGRVAA